MNVVIDAQVINAYYMETFLKGSHLLTANTSELVARFGVQDTVYLDSGNQIYTEWRQCIDDKEWFEGWIPKLLQAGAIQYIKPNLYPELTKSLRQIGFPTSKDIWYVRVAKELCLLNEDHRLISEDIDFYDPSKKKAKHHQKIKIKLNGGPVSKCLKKQAGVIVVCVARYLAEI